MMDHNKKLEFVHKMAKLGLQHFDSGGGVISAGNSNPLSGVAGALTAQNSFNAQAPTASGVVGQQQAGLAGQLQNEAAGNGPNPAQIQYKQNAENIAQQQASLNSQNRAINPGLAARLSGTAAVNAQQTAAGTAAAQQAQQQLGAQNLLEGLTGQEQTGALTAQSINAQTSQNNANSVNQTQGGILGGLAQNIPIIGSLFAEGGKVEKPIKMAVGGSISTPYAPNFSNSMVLQEQQQQSKDDNENSKPGPISGVGQFLNSQPTSANNFGAGDFFSGSAPALGSGEGVGASASPSLMALAAARGGKVPKVDPKLAAKGGPVKTTGPGQEPVVNHDSYKNDRVPAVLTKGETVIDLDTLKRKDEVGKAARFVAQALAKRKLSAK